MNTLAQEDSLTLAKQEAEAQLAVALEWYGITKDFVIQTDKQQDDITGVLRDAKARIDRIEEKRKEFTAPLNKVVKGLNDFFRPPREAFENLERHLKQLVATYLETKARANVTAMQVVATASTPQQAAEALATIAPVAPSRGVSVRPVWKFQVIAPDEVPRELCSPDPKKIAAACQYGPDGQPAPIPGVQWFQESVVTVRK